MPVCITGSIKGRRVAFFVGQIDDVLSLHLQKSPHLFNISQHCCYPQVGLSTPVDAALCVIPTNEAVGFGASAPSAAPAADGAGGPPAPALGLLPWPAELSLSPAEEAKVRAVLKLERASKPICKVSLCCVTATRVWGNITGKC